MPSDTFEIPLVIIYRVKRLDTFQNLALLFCQCICVLIDSVGRDVARFDSKPWLFPRLSA